MPTLIYCMPFEQSMRWHIEPRIICDILNWWQRTPQPAPRCHSVSLSRIWIQSEQRCPKCVLCALRTHWVQTIFANHWSRVLWVAESQISCSLLKYFGKSTNHYLDSANQRWLAAGGWWLALFTSISYFAQSEQCWRRWLCLWQLFNLGYRSFKSLQGILRASPFF